MNLVQVNQLLVEVLFVYINQLLVQLFSMEKKLVEKARGLGTGFYLPEISSPGSTEQLRKLFQEEAPLKQRV